MRNSVIFAVFLLFTAVKVSDADCPGNHGAVLGTFRGITAYSNGSDVSCYTSGCTYGLCYQCVEFVKRFYALEVGDPITRSWGTASEAYDLGDDGLNQYPQGGTVKPAPGDVLCFNGGPAGHVGIVTEVGWNYVKMIDQNRTTSSTDIVVSLSLTGNDDHYTVGTFSGSYSVEGWLRDPDYAYCTYVSQTPAGPFDMQRGETRTFTVQFKNTGGDTWTRTVGPHYVELKSCGAGGDFEESFLYHSSWLNLESPCTMVESSVPPGGTATFTFTGKVPETAPLGYKPVYFRPNHATAGKIQDWSGMHFQVNVTAPSPPPPPPPPPPLPSPIPVFPVSADYDGDHQADIAFFDRRGTGSFRIDWAANGYGAIDVSYPWYGTSLGIWDCPAEYDGDGKVDYAQLNRDFQHGTLQINFAANGFVSGFDQMLDWYGTSYNIIPCPADYNGDGIGDYAQLDLLGTGVWRINYGPVFSDGFQDNFPWYGTSTTIFPCPADYDGDHRSDIAILDRSATGHLKINYASNGFVTGFDADYPWYGESMLIIPYPADYNGDGIGDYAQFDRSTGYFSINYGPNIANGFEEMLPWYGTGEYVYAEPRDYDGDGKDDIATFDQTNAAYAINYASNGFTTGHDLFLNYQTSLNSFPKAEPTTTADLPTSFSLNQNYPNPFNAQTTIAYALAEASHVRLTVYNILGDQVATLIDANQEAGQHQAKWNATDYPSGIYFYRLVTDANTQTTRLTLLK